MRIGFQPSVSEPLVLSAGEDRVYGMRLESLRIDLDTVQVEARSVCGRIAPTAGQAHAVWEQARAALAATHLTRRNSHASTSVVRYERRLTPDGRVLDQRISLGSGLTNAAWHSLAPDSLRRAGYVRVGADGTALFVAPDLDILLDDSFVQDHCFEIARDVQGAMVGLRFEPIPRRRNLSEIRGVVLVDRRTLQLRQLVFAYTGLTRDEEQAQPGGEMTFANLRNGSWVITTWNIRMPILERRWSQVFGGGHPRMELRTILTGLREVGGQLALLANGSDTLWSKSTASVSGVLIDSLTRLPVRRSIVGLRGTLHGAITDTAGGFTLPAVVPGRYVLDVRTPSLDSVNARHSVDLAIVEGGRVTITVPNATIVAESRCGARMSALFGQIRTPGQSVVDGNARVTVEWSEGSSAMDSAVARRWLASHADQNGAFVVCGVPSGTRLAVQASGQNVSSARIESVVPRGIRFARVELIANVGSNDLAGFSGRVLSDVDARPIPGVQIAVDGFARVAFTTDDGAFLVNDIPAGRRRVILRKLGFRQVDALVAFEPGAHIERSFVLSRVQVLDTVAVAEAAVRGDFEANRRIGLGHFLARADLVKQEGRRLSAVIAQLPGVDIAYGRQGGSSYLTSGRGVKSLQPNCQTEFEGSSPGATRRCDCYAQVFLDDMVLFNGREGSVVPDLNRFLVGQIEAIEYYASAAQTPLQYSRLGSRCGVLVIHTRRSIDRK